MSILEYIVSRIQDVSLVSYHQEGVLAYRPESY
jgi:hypothetical protein